MLVNFMTIWPIYWPFRYFSSFGKSRQEKSGNPGLESELKKTSTKVSFFNWVSCAIYKGSIQ
jgi:hypothetical protein